jgi:hypothetical protein
MPINGEYQPPSFHPAWRASRSFQALRPQARWPTRAVFCRPPAIAATGLKVAFHFLARLGGRALLIGVVSRLALCAASLALIRLARLATAPSPVYPPLR